MSDKRIDDILNEYSGDENSRQTSVPKVASEKLQDTGHIEIPKAIKEMESTGVYSQNEIKAIEKSITQKPAPNHQMGKFAVSDINRPNVSYINSVTEVMKTNADLPPRATDLIEGYDGAVMTMQPPDETYIPKVRKMSNSTRAREMREKRRRKKKKYNYTYAVESPDGIYTKPEKKSRKFVISRESEEINQPPVDDGNIVPLSAQSDPSALDIKITEISTKTETDINTGDTRRKKKKTGNKGYEKKKSIKDYDSFEDARAIRRGIAEVRDNISFRVMIMLVLTVFSAYMAIGGEIGLPVPKMLSTATPETYCWVQLVLLSLAVLILISTFKNGILSLLKFRADSDSLTALSAIASAAATVTSAVLNPDMIKNGGMYIYVPVAMLSLLINTVGKKLILNRMAMNFDYISKERNTHAIVTVEDDDRAESLTRGTIGDFPILTTMKRTNFIKDFASYTYSADTGDRCSKVLSPVIFVFSFLLAAVVTFLRMDSFDGEAIAFGLCIFSAAVSVSSCAAIPVIANIPLEKAAKKYVRNQGVMLGYQSVDDFYDTNSVMVSADTFFPTGSINLASIKLFSGTKVENALYEAASLTNYGNSVLKELFTDIITDKSRPLGRVENFAYEDSMGLCGWINNRRILLGNRELMNNHHIEGIPTMTKEKEFTEGGGEALYLSVSGNLAAMFIINVSASTAVVKCMKQLAKNDIAVIVKSVDPFITVTKLSQLFNYPDELIKIIPQRMVKDFDEETKSAKKVSASMACSGRFTSFMQLIMGTKAIRKTVAVGLTIQLAAALLGFILVAMNSILNDMTAISPLVILSYQLISTLLITVFAKSRKV